MHRAKWFGISVQLSEKEKNNSRAERFGTASVLQGHEGSKAKDLKRKVKAERFGIYTPSTGAGEDANKNIGKKKNIRTTSCCSDSTT
ncbi:hypothetical protein RYX36_028654 [Vicia faba]